ncbi:MAG: FG-GAP-like repeat-containing protein [Isosphaeraceae bacterium]
MRRNPVAIRGLVALLILGAAGWSFVEARHRLGMGAARRAMASRAFDSAADQLAVLTGRRPGDGEAWFLLGICESERDREEQARGCWERVPERSPFYGRAAVQLARQALRRHRFAEAEPLMARALDEEGPHAIEARETLVTLFKLEGRYAEARRLVLDAAGRYPEVIGLLKELAQLASHNPFEIHRVESGLLLAYKAAPEDDRIWLGWANLATRRGQFEDAARWLDACTRRRPDDAVVVRARLDLAVARLDPSAAREALRRLPPGSLTVAELLTLRGWFAARSSDEATERAALKELLALEPMNLRAIERLAELELRAGDEAEAARLRARKAELDLTKAEYEVLLFLPDASSHAVKLAQLADRLSRPVEARLLWGLVQSRRPNDPEAAEALARLETPAPPGLAGRDSLAALLRELDTSGVRAADPAMARPTGPIPAFADVAESAGLAFAFDQGPSARHHLPETMSGGVGLIDYDGDGWLDVYCIQGGKFPPEPGGRPSADRLFRNRGDGTFEDATESSGLAAFPGGYGHGVLVGDYDNDGHPDLFLTRWGAYALYRNRGDGTFEDATDRAGLAGYRDWPTSAAFADLDGDGDLDLYVCHYVEWNTEDPQLCYDEKKRQYVYCGPQRFRSLADHIFRNDGGRFVDVTAEAGIVDPHGRGLGVVACDFDGDGLVDLFVSNDQSANYLFRNLGGFRFEEVGAISGVASSADGLYQASMGIACGDGDGDGLPDLVVTNFLNEGTTYYRNLGQGLFADHSNDTGLMSRTRYQLGFGIAFLDANADGWPDLAITNGHVDDFRPDEPWKMPSQLLLGTPRGRWSDASETAGPAWAVPRLGRGLAAGDLNNDGRVDVLILPQGQPLSYLRNDTEGGGHWLILRLEGTGSNRDAIGARVRVVAGGRRQSAWRFGGGSYQSAGDPRLHFGLGDATRVDEIEVAWPSGRVERHSNVGGDRAYLLREGDGPPRALPGFSAEGPCNGPDAPQR